jgi:hypothetical protein
MAGTLKEPALPMFMDLINGKGYVSTFGYTIRIS